MCIFLSLVHTPGAAQYFMSMAPVFWHSENNNHSSSARNQYLLPKAPNAGSAPHTGNERMIVERSHFTKKNPIHHHFICPHQQMQRIFCHGIQTIEVQTRFSHSQKLGGRVQSDCSARGFDNICAVGCTHRVQGWQSRSFSLVLVMLSILTVGATIFQFFRTDNCGEIRSFEGQNPTCHFSYLILFVMIFF